LVYVSTITARVIVHTDEPTTLTVRYNETGSSTEQSVTSPLLSRVHALVLTHLRPSTSDIVNTSDVTLPLVTPEAVGYDWNIDALDASGNPASLHVVNAIPSTVAFSIPRGPDVLTGFSPVPQLRHEHVLTAPPGVSV